VSKLFKNYSKKSINEVRRELARAHLIVATLAGISIALLYMGVSLVEFNASLSIAAAAFLTLLIVVSLSISITIYSEKK